MENVECDMTSVTSATKKNNFVHKLVYFRDGPLFFYRGATFFVKKIVHKL